MFISGRKTSKILKSAHLFYKLAQQEKNHLDDLINSISYIDQIKSNDIKLYSKLSNDLKRLYGIYFLSIKNNVNTTQANLPITEIKDLLMEMFASLLMKELGDSVDEDELKDLVNDEDEIESLFYDNAEFYSEQLTGKKETLLKEERKFQSEEFHFLYNIEELLSSIATHIKSFKTDISKKFPIQEISSVADSIGSKIESKKREIEVNITDKDTIDAIAAVHDKMQAQKKFLQSEELIGATISREDLAGATVKQDPSMVRNNINTIRHLFNTYPQLFHLKKILDQKVITNTGTKKIISQSFLDMISVLQSEKESIERNMTFPKKIITKKNLLWIEEFITNEKTKDLVKKGIQSIIPPEDINKELLKQAISFSEILYQENAVEDTVQYSEEYTVKKWLEKLSQEDLNELTDFLMADIQPRPVKLLNEIQGLWAGNIQKHINEGKLPEDILNKTWFKAIDSSPEFRNKLGAYYKYKAKQETEKRNYREQYSVRNSVRSYKKNKREAIKEELSNLTQYVNAKYKIGNKLMQNINLVKTPLPEPKNKDECKNQLFIYNEYLKALKELQRQISVPKEISDNLKSAKYLSNISTVGEDVLRSILQKVKTFFKEVAEKKHRYDYKSTNENEKSIHRHRALIIDSTNNILTINTIIANIRALITYDTESKAIKSRKNTDKNKIIEELYKSMTRVMSLMAREVSDFDDKEKANNIESILTDIFNQNIIIDRVITAVNNSTGFNYNNQEFKESYLKLALAVAMTSMYENVSSKRKSEASLLLKTKEQKENFEKILSSLKKYKDIRNKTALELAANMDSVSEKQELLEQYIKPYLKMITVHFSTIQNNIGNEATLWSKLYPNDVYDKINKNIVINTELPQEINDILSRDLKENFQVTKNINTINSLKELVTDAYNNIYENQKIVGENFSKVLEWIKKLEDATDWLKTITLNAAKSAESSTEENIFSREEYNDFMSQYDTTINTNPDEGSEQSEQTDQVDIFDF